MIESCRVIAHVGKHRLTPGGAQAGNVTRVFGLARSGDWPEFAQESQAAMPQAVTIHLALDLRLHGADLGFDLIGALQKHGKLIDCVALQGVEADAVDLAQGLVAMDADQTTTDDPAGLSADFREMRAFVRCWAEPNSYECGTI